MSYMINLTNIIGEFPAWNLSTETRKNKYLEFEAPKRKFQRELNILNYTKCSVRDLSFFAKYPLLKKIISDFRKNIYLKMKSFFTMFILKLKGFL